MNIERTFIWPRQMTTILSFSCHDKKSTANVGELFVIWRKYIFFMPEEMPWKVKHSPFVYLSSIKNLYNCVFEMWTQCCIERESMR